MKSYGYLNNAKGAVAPLVAIMLVVIIVCVALVVDLGHIHNVKIQLQRAVDAAALAAAKQLNGSADQVANARAIAVATAAANDVTEIIFVDAECKYSSTESCLGTWNADDLNLEADARFNQTEDSPEAVLVRAARVVPHIFFFFVDSTQVSADAIAVAEPFNPVLPLALISCTPTDEIAQSPGTLPGMTVCDIKTYSFNNDQDDTAAWTSLTFDVNANQVKNYMEPGTGREQFNQVVFGKDLPEPNFGIENTAVDSSASSFSSSYPGCQPDGLDIDCGLGRIGTKDIARWDEFTGPSPLPALVKDAVTGIYSPSGFDPMTGYGINRALPRWYNLNPDPDFQDDDHFTRVWSQDGILLIGENESFADYQTRLASYRNGSDLPYGDNRFVAGAGVQGDIIETYSGGTRNQILAGFESAGISTVGAPSTILFPNFKVVPGYAGYPKVYVFNGVAGSILNDFLANPDVMEESHLKCRQDPDLPPDEHAMIVNMPVIFAGDCETWQALSLGNNNFTLSYVGMAKFLMTRVWRNPDDYDCGSNFVNVGSPCDPTTFNPPPGGGNLLSAVNFNTPGALEGVHLYPVPDELARQASLLKVVLVE
jgi:hypothetical protein